MQVSQGENSFKKHLLSVTSVTVPGAGYKVVKTQTISLNLTKKKDLRVLTNHKFNVSHKLIW